MASQTYVDSESSQVGPCASSVAITTASDGSATEYLGPFTGYLNRIVYTKTDFATGVDFTATIESTGENVWTATNQDASAVKAPRTPTHDGVGAASLYAAGGEPVEDKILLVRDRIKIVIAQGGNAKVGTFKAYIC